MNDLVRFSDMFDRMMKFFDNVFETPVDSVRFPSFEESWFNCGNFPPAEVVLKENRDLQYKLAIAGYPKNDVSIEFDGDHMVISGKYQSESKDKNDRYLTRGIKRSNFEAKFYVPHSRYEQEKAEATFQDGLLTILVPSKEKRERVKLPIK